MGNCCRCCCCAKKPSDVIEPAHEGKEKLIEKSATPEVVAAPTYNVLTVNNSETTIATAVIVDKSESPKDSPKSSSPKSLPSDAPSSPPRQSNSRLSDVDVDLAVDPSSKSPAVSALMPKVLSPKHRALSSRSSFTQTKEHREFRFFLPILEDGDDDWIPSEQKEAWNRALEAVKKEFVHREDEEDTEVRDDTYLIGKSYFGLKYRDDQKLEMKVKTENKPIWMEKWSKVRFGKKQIGHYKSDILSYLQDVGHKDPSHEKLIDEPQFITIHKRRDVGPDGKVSVEVGELSVSKEQVTFQGEVRRRAWLTVSIEGDSNAIEGFVWQHNTKNEAGESVWDIMQLGRTIYDQHNESAVTRSFVPVISGYPLWIELVADKFRTADALSAEILPSLDAFLTFLKPF